MDAGPTENARLLSSQNVRPELTIGLGRRFHSKPVTIADGSAHQSCSAVASTRANASAGLTTRLRNKLDQPNALEEP